MAFSHSDTEDLVTDPSKDRWPETTTRKQRLDMSVETCRERTMLSVPCHVGDPDLWFAENPLDLERAKAL